MDIGKSFVDSWNLYIKNFIVVLLSFIVVAIVGGITVGILSVPLMVGFQMMFVKGKRGEPLSFNGVFAYFKDFFKLFFGAILILVIALLVMAPSFIFYWLNWNTLGTLFSIAGGIVNIYLMVSWMFALLLVADKGLAITDALKASRDIVTRNNWWMHFLLVILAGIVGQIGSFAWGIGAMLTMPLAMGAVACAYEEEAK